MLTSRSLVAELQIDPEAIRAALEKVEEQGWQPALIETDCSLLRLAGIDPAKLPQVRRRRANISSSVEGDVFFREDGIYYLLYLASVTAIYEYLGSHALGPQDRSSRRALRPRVIVGVISDDATEIDGRLQAFAELVSSALPQTHHDDEDAPGQLDWQQDTSAGKLDRLNLT